jgi:hypothetical protein
VKIYNKLIPNIGVDMIELILLIFIAIPLIIFSVLGLAWAAISLIVELIVYYKTRGEK